jgi:hypothetical protein
MINFFFQFGYSKSLIPIIQYNIKKNSRYYFFFSSIVIVFWSYLNCFRIVTFLYWIFIINFFMNSVLHIHLDDENI